MVNHNLKDSHPPSKGWSSTIKRMVIHHPQDDHPPSKGWSSTIQRMVIHHPMDSHSPSPGYSPTIPRTVTPLPQIWSANFKSGQPQFQGWSTPFQRMFNHHPKDHHKNGQPPSPRKLLNIPIVGHPKSLGLSPTIPIMFTHNPMQSPTIPRMVTTNLVRSSFI